MNGDGPVGAVILAAGMSRRFGSPKQLGLVDGRTLLEHAVDGALEGGLDPVMAVVPSWLIRPASLDRDSVRWVRNPFPERGLSLSLRLGIGALPEEVTAAVILLGDQPRVPGTTIRALLAARGERPVVVSEARGVLAPPLLVERTHFAIAGELRGDTGLRAWLAANPNHVRSVPVAGHPPDVDVPEDLGRLAGP